MVYLGFGKQTSEQKMVSPDKIMQNNDLRLVRGKYFSELVSPNEGFLNSPNQIQRRASGFGVVTNFDAAFSPVVSEKSSKISKPELLSMRSEYV